MQNSSISSKKNVALAGATGLIGTYCLDLLLESPHIQKVTVLTRRSLSQEHPKLCERVIDFSVLDSISLTDPVDTLICCLGTTIKEAGSQAEFEKVDLNYVVSLAQWGLKHRAKHFLVVSSMGADPKSSIFYNRIKGKMEAEVSQLGYQSLDIFRPSLLVGQRAKARLGEKVAGKLLQLFQPAMQGPLRQYRPIPAESVAKAILSYVTHSQPGLRVHPSNEIEAINNQK